MSCRLGAAVLATLTMSTATASAERPRTGVIESAQVQLREVPPSGLIPYNTLFLNRCPSGCTITVGDSNSKTDRWPISQQRVLTSFPYGDEAWNKVVACVRDVMSPFQINVVTSNPGSANHFEIMIAGRATDLDDSWTNYGGVAPGTSSAFCDSYVDNGLVFAFAKAYGTGSVCDDDCVNEVCATAAQEIGHVWNRMDHVTLPSDPMTYYGYSGRRYFQNTAAKCGSDCVSGVAPGGVQCSGLGNQEHECKCGGPTQNSHATITSLFGAGAGTPPMTTITRPTLGESVDQGFQVHAEVTDDSNIINRVELRVDGMLVTTLTAPPYYFTAPTNLAMGTRRVEVTAYDGHMTPGSAQVDVIVGPPCADADDCPNGTDVCVGGRCVPGPMADGGLGTTCTESIECRSTRCASDGTDSHCVELCLAGQCPDDFGCLDDGTGTGMGVCWPGYDDSGGCGCQTSRGGPAGMLFALLVMVLTCRRRR